MLELRSSRPASMWNLTDEPSLAKQNSSLAKSASALNQSDKTAEGASLSSRGNPLGYVCFGHFSLAFFSHFPNFVDLITQFEILFINSKI